MVRAKSKDGLDQIPRSCNLKLNRNLLNTMLQAKNPLPDSNMEATIEQSNKDLDENTKNKFLDNLIIQSEDSKQ